MPDIQRRLGTLRERGKDSVTNKLILFSMALALAWSLSVFATVVHAETVAQAYTLDHPINPDWLILATVEGRWQIERQGDCDWLSAYQNVAVYSTEATTVLAQGDNSCLIGVLGLVDTAPCYGTDVCDVAFELPE